MPKIFSILLRPLFSASRSSGDFGGLRSGLRRTFVLLSVVLATKASMSQAASLPEPSASQLPMWRGFNLLEKFHLDWNNKPFVEDDFKWISEWGFNFVRLPMDYRTWILGGDWRKFNEDVLKEIDQAVAWGRKY